MKPKVYFVGASGVGKTTLAKYVHEKFGLPFVPSKGMDTLKDLGLTFADIMSNIDAGDSYQMNRLRDQMEAEAAFWTSEEEGFVSDRSLDVVAYTARLSRITWQVVRSDLFQEQVSRMRGLKGGRVVTFFVRPHKNVMAQLDGRRDDFLSMEWRYAVDGMLELLLEYHEIPYFPISCHLPKDRCRLVEGVINLATRK